VPRSNLSDSVTNLDLAAFEPSRPLKQQLEELTRLIKVRAIHTASKTPEFDRWLIHLRETAGITSEPEPRMLAVAALTRIAATVNALRSRIAGALSSALTEPLPPLDTLRNPDDRTYVAQACSIAQAPWCVTYLANAAVLEESAEKARAECFRSLLKLSSSLQTILQLLRDHIGDFEPAKESPADSVGRRLRRILVALRRAMATKVVDSGSDPGDVLADLLRAAFKKYGAPSEYKIAEALANEVAVLVHELIGARFSLAVDAASYKALRIVRAWFDYRWPEFVSSSKPMAGVRSDLREAITILAKQGKTDDELADALEVASGSRTEARSLLAQIGEEVVGLEDSVRSWFLGTSPATPPTSIDDDSHAAESQRLREARDLAEVLIYAADLMQLATSMFDQLTGEQEISHIPDAGALRSFAAKARATSDLATSFARHRSLELRGQVGDEVEFSPLEHDLIGGTLAGIRKVRIVQPAVAYRNPGSSPVIVKKAVVEPSRTQR
jgi:hypothetical protein